MTKLSNSNPQPKTSKLWQLIAGLLVAVSFSPTALTATVGTPISKPIYKIHLNDTGITTCSDSSKNNLPCPQKLYPGQDAQYGRDKTVFNNSDGIAGFSFTKIGSTGKALAASAPVWNCVKDNVTGLMWEHKTDDNGLHDKDSAYRWYEPNNKINGGSQGTQNGGNCSTTTECDTYTYIKAVNKAGWCGFKDWRMPTIEELFNLTLFDRIKALEPAYFPDEGGATWSSSSDVNNPSHAWYINYGGVYNDLSKNNQSLSVRLVRGRQ